IHKDRDGDASFQLKSDSLPHAHAHSTKTFYKQRDSKNQESSSIKDKDFRYRQYANVAWVIAKCMKRKGAGSQKDSQICCCQFISKIARKSRVLTEEIIRSLSTLVYCRDLDRTTLRELIDSEDRLIPDIPVDDVPRVAA
ncbi:hypothetical protein Tco_0879274, partial [Tanacetum coccineum]